MADSVIIPGGTSDAGHHRKDKPAIDTNYAAHLSFIDAMFGTFHMPKKHWPKEYGTLVRLPRTFLGQLLYPFAKPKVETPEMEPAMQTVTQPASKDRRP